MVVGFAPARTSAQDTPSAPENAEGQLLPAQGGAGQPVRAQEEPLAAPRRPKSTAAETPAAGQPTEVQAQPEGPVVALLDLETDTLSTKQVEALSQALWARINAEAALQLLERGPVRRQLIRNDLYPFTPYRPAIAPADVARALKANYLVTGHIDQVEDMFVMDVSVYSAPAGKYVMLDAQMRRTSLNHMLEAIGELAGMVHQAIVEDKAFVRTEAAPATEEPPAAEAAPHKPQSVPVPVPPAKEIGPVLKVRRRPTPAAKQPTPRKSTRKRAMTEPEGMPPPAPERTAEEARPTPPPPRRAAEAQKSTEEPATETPRPTATPRPTPTAMPQAAKETPRAGGNQAEARRLYREALKAKEKSPERLEKLARAAELAPHEFTYQQQLAMEYYRQKKFQESIEQSNRALKLRPKSSILETVKGSALFELGRYEEARAAFEAALATDPNNDWARYNVALTQMMLKSPEAAQAWRDYIERAQSKPSQKSLVERAREYLAALESSATK